MLKEIGSSIWQITGNTPGPSLAILGGIHGNEQTGIHTIRKLYETFNTHAQTLSSGTLYLVLGNLQAIEKDTRSTEEGGGSTGGAHDLNRMFEDERFDREPDGTYEDARAREIAKLVLDHVEYSIDIHSVNKPSNPFLACKISPRHEKIYRWFATDRVVDDPYFLLGGKPVTTDEYVNKRGSVGICFETGFAKDTSRITEVYESILNILRDLHMITDEALLPDATPKTPYVITEKIFIDDRGFTFAPGMGIESFQTVKQGEIIGMQGNDPYVAPYDGVLIFPEREEKCIPGAIATWIAQKSTP